MITTLAIVLPVGMKISSLFMARLYRTPSAVNNYAAKVFAISSDIHYQLSSPGSTQELVK